MPYSQFDPASQAPQPLLPQASVHDSSRWLPVLGAALGLVGLIAGVAGCSRPATSTEAAKPVYSDQQVADAKKAVCSAFEQGVRSIRAAGARKPDNPADPFPATVVNIRLAAVAVGNSFFHSVASNPAAPPELSDLLTNLGNDYQNIALIQLADGQKADFNPLIAQADDLVSKIQNLCQ